MPRRVLIVEPDDHYRRTLFAAACDLGALATVRDSFQDARRLLATAGVDVLIANSRLGPYNGIHLVYLARQQQQPATCVVYGNDAGIGADAQQAGAFWERPQFLPFTLASILTAKLPDHDRRDPHRIDRRVTFRGGRRASDSPELHAAVTSLPRA